tara:strand:+ start:16 stop:267 length:252 start_codon:yes stop_codon:yes gene_type:complete
MLKVYRADEPQPKWRSSPSTTGDKARIVEYLDDLEDAMFGQQTQLDACWKMFHSLAGKNELLHKEINQFLSSQPAYKYRKDRG